MIHTHLLVRYGEIFLKGKNRKYFENQLARNIKSLTGVKDINKLRCRFVIDYFTNHRTLRNVFGIISYSPALKAEKDIGAIKRAALNVVNTTGSSSFKVETKRSDKKFPLKSPEINIEIGKYIENKSDFKFSFEKPEVVLHIEINQGAAYIFTEIVACHGGLPTRVEGKVNLLVEGEESILAGLLMMKRGTSIVPIVFNNQDISNIDISILKKYYPGELELKKINDLNELKNEVLVVGQNFNGYKKVGADLTLRPLIAYSKEQIKEELENYRVAKCQ